MDNHLLLSLRPVSQVSNPIWNYYEQKVRINALQLINVRNTIIMVRNAVEEALNE